MAAEYRATCEIFPIDSETLNYLRLTGRDEDQVNLVEAYAKARGNRRDKEPVFSNTLPLNLDTVEPSLAGPKRPQDRVPLSRRSSSAKTSDGRIRCLLIPHGFDTVTIQ